MSKQNNTAAPADSEQYAADLAAELSATHGLPVVDGVAAAVTLAEGLIRLGLSTSRLGPYAAPRAKTYSGPFAPFQP